MDASQIVVCSTLAVSFLYAALQTWKNRALNTTLQLPPGPKSLPFIGNLFDINVGAPWLTYTEWGKQYGKPIFFVKIVKF